MCGFNFDPKWCNWNVGQVPVLWSPAPHQVWKSWRQRLSWGGMLNQKQSINHDKSTKIVKQRLFSNQHLKISHRGAAFKDLLALRCSLRKESMDLCLLANVMFCRIFVLVLVLVLLLVVVVVIAIVGWIHVLLPLSLLLSLLRSSVLLVLASLLTLDPVSNQAQSAARCTCLHPVPCSLCVTDEAGSGRYPFNIGGSLSMGIPGS